MKTTDCKRGYLLGLNLISYLNVGLIFRRKNGISFKIKDQYKTQEELKVMLFDVSMYPTSMIIKNGENV